MKYLVITNFPTPHKVDILNELSNLLDIDVAFRTLKTRRRREWKTELEDANFNYFLLDSWKIEFSNAYESGYLLIPKKLPDLSKYSRILLSGGLSIPEIVIAHSIRKAGKQYVLWTGETTLRWGRNLLLPVRYVFRRYLYTNALKVVCANESARKHAQRMGAKDTIVAYTTFKFDRFLYERKHYGNKPRILYVGRLIAIKRVQDLLRAVSMYDDLELHIYGDGPMKPSLMKLARKLFPDGRVSFKEMVPYERIHEIYRNYDILVLPSEKEVHGFVVMEALLSSVAVIVSDQVGAKDFVLKEFVFPTGKVEELAKRIELARSHELRNKAVEYGRNMILKEANLKTTARRIKEALVG